MCVRKKVGLNMTAIPSVETSHFKMRGFFMIIILAHTTSGVYCKDGKIVCGQIRPKKEYIHLKNM